MSQHSRHGATLREILMDAEDVRRSFDASELADCPECREAMEEHMNLLTDLEDLAADERAILAEGDGSANEGPLQLGRAEEALRRHALDDAPEVPNNLRLLRWAGLAAGVLLLVLAGRVLLPPSDGPGPGDPDAVLGTESGLVHPVGPVQAYAPFRWDVELPAGGHFKVRVEAEGFRLESERLYEQEWTPSDTQDWPTSIRWTLTVHGGSGQDDVAASLVEWASLEE